jgi:hypothetical protein
VKRLLLAAALLLVACSDDDGLTDSPLVDVTVGQDGSSLHLFVGSCGGPYQVTVDEDDDEVRLTARGQQGGPTDDCGGADVGVELFEPLGDRQVIDTTTGDPVEVVDR